MSFSTTTIDHVIRSNIWSNELKMVLEDELMGTRYVKMITDFPDGDTFNMVSVGEADVSNYVENTPVRYTAMDTGNFQFVIDQYKHSATFITEREKQDSWIMSQIIPQFVPKQARAIQTAMEERILAVGPERQVASDLNNINGAPHRFVGSGASAVLTVNDFARAMYSLKKANVPDQNMVAIVDPSVEFTMNTLTNLSNVSNNPRWEGIVADGIGSGMRFIKNIYGFDVYTSNRLRANAASETINGVVAPAGNVSNLFFSAASDVLPIVGAIRQAPKVDSSYNKDFQREEYVTTCRYGFSLFRPENLVTILSNPVV
jgi:hypothetical protein